jgi:chaperonin GroES
MTTARTSFLIVSLLDPRTGCAGETMLRQSHRGQACTLSLSEQPPFHGSRTLYVGRQFNRYPHVWSHMKVKPLHDRLIVQRLEEGEQKIGGIIVPDSAKEKPMRGKVLAVGLGKVKEDGSRQQPDVKNGDTILFGKYSGQEIKIDGEDYLIMREDDVLAIIDTK